MYTYTEIIFGFDFSDNKYPQIGEILPKSIYEYLIEGDELKSFYSGISSPYFIGKEMAVYDPFRESKKSLIEIVEDVKENINNHYEYYKNEIINEIDDIINSIQNESRNYIDEYEYTEDDILQSIVYFTKLKTIVPSIVEIIATS